MIRVNVICHGETKVREFAEGAFTVGRSRRCDLVVKELSNLSREHCRIEQLGSRCRVVDLSSRNGMQINGEFKKQCVAGIGDRISLGQLTLEFLEIIPAPQLEQTEDIKPRNGERVKPCMSCGELIAFEKLNCPSCEYQTHQRRLSKIPRDRIPGFSLEKKLGSGGMGIVFEAIRESDNERVAIKVLRPHLARNPAYQLRFVEETRVLTMLKHPHIVQVFGRGSDEGITYIEMELIRGESVRHRIRHLRQLEEKESLQIVWDMVVALDYAAKKKVIHGDVKPSNFLLDSSGAAKLCDFGLARLFNFNDPKLPGFSPEASGKRGTAAYAAPERFRDGAKPTIAADIYAMGVSLFQMTTGELPFGGNKAARGKIDRRSIPDPTLFNRELRSSTAILMERMLATDPLDRYASYRELQDDLAILLDA